MAIATTLQSGDALIIVDLQNDFLTGGALAVSRADEIVPVLREYAARFERQQLPIFATRDWHPEDHGSFRAQGGPWPAHCVQFTPGAEFPAGLELPPSAVTFSKGMPAADEGLSAFGDPPFEATLRTLRVRRLFIGGVTTEQGVRETVRRALDLGFEVFFLRDAVRALNLKPEDGLNAETEMIRFGAVPLSVVNLCQRSPAASALLSDVFEVTMLHAYAQSGMNDTAVFEFAVRRLPPGQNFLVAAGLEQVLQFLEELHFTDCEIEWIERTRRISPDFTESLRRMRFTGDVEAMAEGTLFFAHEPVLRITAPIAQAQLVENRVISLLRFPTLVASKAARFVMAAPGRTLSDSGLQRTYGAEAAVMAARACYLAGFGATSDALAAQQFGITATGTMTRSFVEAAASEVEAFRRFAQSEPDNVVLLIDTFDTEAAARTVVRLAPELRGQGIVIKGVRIERGDLAEHARRVRQILDAGGLSKVHIFASGNFDEYALQQIVGTGAPINGFGVGARLVAAADVAGLDCDYQLQRFDVRRHGRRAEGESNWPGVKQVYRIRDSIGRMDCDVVALADEAHEGEPLLKQVMRAGRRVGNRDSFPVLRERVARQIRQLPSPLRSLSAAPVSYPVFMSEKLHAICLDAGVFPGGNLTGHSAAPFEPEPEGVGQGKANPAVPVRSVA